MSLGPDTNKSRDHLALNFSATAPLNQHASFNSASNQHAHLNLNFYGSSCSPQNQALVQSNNNCETPTGLSNTQPSNHINFNHDGSFLTNSFLGNINRKDPHSQQNMQQMGQTQTYSNLKKNFNMLLFDDSNTITDHLSNTQTVPQTTTAAFNHYSKQ